MKCPHCGTSYHVKDDDWEVVRVKTEGAASMYDIRATSCPSCGKPIIWLDELETWIEDVVDSEMVYPRTVNRSPLSEVVPYNLQTDFKEACEVLSISPKASAALSRRVLQALLGDQGYTSRDLSGQIEAVLFESDPEKVLPSQVRAVVDAIRNFGNFSAHPISDVTTLQVIEVEPNEAEWCIQILEALFDHYFVRPAEDAARLAVLNSKLEQSGKPIAKS